MTLVPAYDAGVDSSSTQVFTLPVLVSNQIVQNLTSGIEFD